VLPGAGNFRRMAGPPVYGVAMCTLDGIRNVLNAVAQQQAQAGGPTVSSRRQQHCRTWSFLALGSSDLLSWLSCMPTQLDAVRALHSLTCSAACQLACQHMV
jgi:hypothetical protein